MGLVRAAMMGSLLRWDVRNDRSAAVLTWRIEGVGKALAGE